MKTRSLAVVAAGAMFLASCGGSSDSTASDDGASDDSSEDSEFVYESPLGEFLGWSDADFDEEALEAQYADQEREVQEQAAACMQELGFEYIPVDTAAQNAFFQDQFEDDLEWGSKEWTEKFGFGVTTQRFSQTQVGPDLVGSNWDIGPDQEGPPDPNQEYVESLGPSEQEAYYAALYGGEDDYEIPIWEIEERDPTDEEIEAYDANYEPTGCLNIAYEEIFASGPGEGDWEKFDEEFGEALNEMEERMESHPEVIAYQDEVRSCVEDRGVEYLTEEDSYQYFEAELEAAGLGWDSQPDPFEGIDTTDFTDEDYERIWQESQTKLLPADQLEALGELQALEIETAVAIRECGGGWENEQEALADVRIELEEEFLAANADRLAEFEGTFGS